MDSLILNQMMNCNVVIGVSDLTLLDRYAEAIRSFISKNKAKIKDDEIVIHGNRKTLYISALLTKTNLRLIVGGKFMYLNDVLGKYKIKSSIS